MKLQQQSTNQHLPQSDLDPNSQDDYQIQPSTRMFIKHTTIDLYGDSSRQEQNVDLNQMEGQNFTSSQTELQNIQNSNDGEEVQQQLHKVNSQEFDGQDYITQDSQKVQNMQNDLVYDSGFNYLGERMMLSLRSEFEAVGHSTSFNDHFQKIEDDAKSRQKYQYESCLNSGRNYSENMSGSDHQTIVSASLQNLYNKFQGLQLLSAQKQNLLPKPQDENAYYSSSPNKKQKLFQSIDNSKEALKNLKPQSIFEENENDYMSDTQFMKTHEEIDKLLQTKKLELSNKKNKQMFKTQNQGEGILPYSNGNLKVQKGLFNDTTNSIQIKNQCSGSSIMTPRNQNNMSLTSGSAQQNLHQNYSQIGKLEFKSPSLTKNSDKEYQKRSSSFNRYSSVKDDKENDFEEENQLQSQQEVDENYAELQLELLANGFVDQTHENNLRVDLKQFVESKSQLYHTQESKKQQQIPLNQSLEMPEEPNSQSPLPYKQQDQDLINQKTKEQFSEFKKDFNDLSHQKNILEQTNSSVIQSEAGSQQSSSRKFVVSYNKTKNKESVKVIHSNPHDIYTPQKLQDQASIQSQSIRQIQPYNLQINKSVKKSKESVTSMVNQRQETQVNMMPFNQNESAQSNSSLSSTYNQSQNLNQVNLNNSQQIKYHQTDKMSQRTMTNNPSFLNETPCFDLNSQMNILLDSNKSSMHQNFSNLDQSLQQQIQQNFQQNLNLTSLQIKNQELFFSNDSKLQLNQTNVDTPSLCSLSQNNIQDHDSINQSISRIINSIELIPDSDTVQAEELVLQLHRYIKKGLEIPQELREQLQDFQKRLQHIFYKSDKELSSEQNDQKTFLSSEKTGTYQFEIPYLLRDLKDKDILNNYYFFAQELSQATNKFNIKQLQTFCQMYQNQQPSKFEQQVVQSLLLIFSNQENSSIKLTVDRKNLVDRNFSSILKYLSNYGRTMQQIREIKHQIDNKMIDKQQIEQIRNKVINMHESSSNICYNSSQKQSSQELSNIGLEIFHLLRASINYYDFISQFYQQNISKSSQKMKRSKSSTQPKPILVDFVDISQDNGNTIEIEETNEEQFMNNAAISPKQLSSKLSTIVESVNSCSIKAQSITSSKLEPTLLSPKAHQKYTINPQGSFTQTRKSIGQPPSSQKKPIQISNQKAINEKYIQKRFSINNKCENLPKKNTLRNKSIESQKQERNSQKIQTAQVRSKSQRIRQTQTPKTQNMRKDEKFQLMFNLEKFELNNRIYEENLEFERQARDQRQDIENAKKMITQMRGKEKLIKVNLDRQSKAQIQQTQKQDQVQYMEYQAQMRKNFIQFIAQRMKDDKLFINEMNKQGILEARWKKIHDNADLKLKLIDEFKKTIENVEWNKHYRELQVKLQKTQKHQDFMESLQSDRIYKEQIYAAKKLVEHSERMHERKINVNYEQLKVMREQEQALKDLELMARFLV